MQNSDRLTSLIEQASLAVNMLNPTDVSDVESLQAILDQINRTVAKISDAPIELLEQAKGAGSEATEALAKILRQEAEDSARSIEVVSQVVCSLQSLIDQITQTGASADSEPAETGLSPTVEPGPEEAAVIPEEDVPLIIDFIAEGREHIESAEASTGCLAATR